MSRVTGRTLFWDVTINRTDDVVKGRKLITPLKGTKAPGNKLSGNVPNRLACETLAHACCNFGPFGLEIRVHQKKE